VRSRHCNPTVASLEMMKDECRWVRAVAPTASHHLCFIRNVLNVVLPSSVGLEGDAFGGLSMATKSAHVVSHSDASTAIVLVIRSISLVRSFLLLVLTLRTHMLTLWTLVLFASGAALRPLSLPAPRYLKVGKRSCATRHCVQRCHRDPFPSVARSSISMAVLTLSFIPRCP
jgi:hypothetical protein